MYWYLFVMFQKFYPDNSWIVYNSGAPQRYNTFSPNNKINYFGDII